MRAAFYDPYLDTLGGGERYTLTLAEALNQHGWQTAFLWDGPEITIAAKDKFGLDVSQTTYLPNIFVGTSLIKRISYLQHFDLVFYISDGSLPLLSGKYNLVHLQVPFHDVNGHSFFNQLKKHSIHQFVVNSAFTKGVVDKEYAINSRVIYPPVDVDTFVPHPKQNIILYLARFSNLLQQKGHEVVIRAFKQLCDSGIHNYKLWLAGSTEVGAEKLIHLLCQQASGYPIELSFDLPLSDLKQLYGKSKLFWTASGFGVDEHLEPEKCEHFGISLVEAMAAGCVPLAVRKGGFQEIIQDGVNGFLWDTIDDLIRQTKELTKHPAQVKRLQLKASHRAETFSKQEFVDQFLHLIKI